MQGTGQGNGGSSRVASGKFPTHTAPPSSNTGIVAFSRSHGERNQENSPKSSLSSLVPNRRNRAYKGSLFCLPWHWQGFATTGAFHPKRSCSRCLRFHNEV